MSSTQARARRTVRPLSDFLRRVRPVGAPGPPARSGVPADLAPQLAEELAPVFEALRATEEEAAALVAEGQREAERRRLAAAAQVRSLLGEARQQAEATRATAAAAAVEAAEAEHSELLRRAHEDAEGIRRRAAERLPALTERVVAAVRAAAGEPGRIA